MVYQFYCMALFHSQTRFHMIIAVSMHTVQSLYNIPHYNTDLDRTQTCCVIQTFYYAILQSKKAKIRNRYNQAPHWNLETVWESYKYTRKHHIQESPEVSPFPAGDHKAARHRQDSIMAKTNTILKKSR